MGTEIERKFLVKTDVWRPKDAGTHFRQGYLNSQKERVVRVRIEGHVAKLTIKGLTHGITRREFEYPIPVPDATVLLDHLCEQPLIDKHGIEYDALKFSWIGSMGKQQQICVTWNTSPIKTLKELEGKRVGINELGQGTGAMPMALKWLQSAGVDPKKITSCVVQGGIGNIGGASVVLPNTSMARNTPALLGTSPVSAQRTVFVDDQKRMQRGLELRHVVEYRARDLHGRKRTACITLEQLARTQMT